MNLKLKHFLIALCGLVLTALSVFVPGRGGNAEEMKAMKLGLPYSFIQQDFSAFDQKIYYPHYRKLDWARRTEVPIKNFSPLKFLASFFVVFLVLEIVIYVLETIDFKLRCLYYRWRERGEKEKKEAPVEN